MSNLHPPRLGFEQAGNECAAVKLAADHAAQACKRGKYETDEQFAVRVWEAKSKAARGQIKHSIWMTPAVDALAHDFPDAKRDGPDVWARAGLAHGILDWFEGKGPRHVDESVPELKRDLYISAYCLGRARMG